MRRSTSVQLVLLPMLATAAVASAQPGPQDPQPPPDDPNGQLSPPGMTDPSAPQLSPPGMTPVMDPQAEQQEDGVVCNEPETWPQENQELGVPPYDCRAVIPRCDDPNTWDERSRELNIPPEGCRREYGVFTVDGGWGNGGVIRGGFGHYFGTGGG